MYMFAHVLICDCIHVYMCVLVCMLVPVCVYVALKQFRTTRYLENERVS